jgi:hypothetical protein
MPEPDMPPLVEKLVLLVGFLGTLWAYLTIYPQNQLSQDMMSQ